MSKRSVLMIFLLVFSLNLAIISAQQGDFNHIISNSDDWRDVYSILRYAKIQGIEADFLTNTRHGPLLLTGINKNKNIQVITSEDHAFVLNYDSTIRSQGFAGADEFRVDNANLDLINELPDITNFVIVGDTYGYNAIAVAPYAAQTNSWVFLASRTNIDEIELILSNRNVDNVLIYGYVDREISDALAQYNPEIIDNGDRFKDNVEIVERYLEVNPVNQVTLTNGEFIEKEIMAGREPILFTGKESVPDQISKYIQSSDIEVGVLIGADLVGAATNIRRSTGISVIVKFARGARSPAGSIAAVENLDLFYLPIPILELDITAAKYNRATSELELTYQSTSSIPVFFKGTITPLTEDGEQTRIGDIDPIFIAPNDLKTVVYPDLDLTGNELSLDVFTLYGDTPTSLEKVLDKVVDIASVNVIDECKINIVSAKYNIPKQRFVIKVENVGDVACYADVELEGVIIDGTPTTIGSEGSILIQPGKTGKVYIDQEMLEEDLKENKFVNVVAYHGEREDGLVKVLKGRYELEIQKVNYATIGLSILAIIIIIALIWFFILWKRRKDDEDDPFR